MTNSYWYLRNMVVKYFTIFLTIKHRFQLLDWRDYHWMVLTYPQYNLNDLYWYRLLGKVDNNFVQYKQTLPLTSINNCLQLPDELTISSYNGFQLNWSKKLGIVIFFQRLQGKMRNFFDQSVKYQMTDSYRILDLYYIQLLKLHSTVFTCS